MAIQKLAHAELRVDDIGRALEYNVELFGLRELARDGDTVYLGCGLDNNYDLALIPGGTGISHFAYQVASEDDLQGYKKRIEQYGISVEERTDAEPGQQKSIGFVLPGTHQTIRMELVTVEDRPQYLHPALSPNRQLQGAGPIDLDHVNLMVANANQLADFLKSALDFRISDIFQPAPGFWGAVWSRATEHHHDLGFMAGRNPNETLNHIAFTFEGLDHMKRALDMLAKHDLKLEFGLGRHGIGGNLYAYYWAPGGNRYELTAEMPRVVDDKAEPVIWEDLYKGISAWGMPMVDSLGIGS